MGDLVRSTFLAAGDRVISFGRILFLSVIVFWAGGLLAIPVFEVDVNGAPSWLRILVLMLWVVLLLVVVRYASGTGVRTRILKFLMRDGDYGWLSPLLLVVVVFWFTTIGFAALTHLLWEWGLVDLTDPSCATPCPLDSEHFFDFYTWHFLESIPIFRINETLHWREPLVYRGAAAGWLVVALKVAVILPLIQVIRSYWKLRSETPGLRIEAWRRVVGEGDPVRVTWALSEPPAGYVFDVYVEEPGGPHPTIGGQDVAAAASETEMSKEQQLTSQLVGPGWRLWRGDETRTSAEYVPEWAGTYRFQARWRKATEHRARASNTPRTVKVIVKQRAAPAFGSGESGEHLSRPPAASAAGHAEEFSPGGEQ
jgi:hypothetical protein